MLSHLYWTFSAITLAELIAIPLQTASILNFWIDSFKLIQQKDTPTSFIMVEVYKDEGTPAKHKKIPYYRK